MGVFWTDRRLGPPVSRSMQTFLDSWAVRQSLQTGVCDRSGENSSSSSRLILCSTTTVFASLSVILSLSLTYKMCGLCFFMKSNSASVTVFVADL